MKSKYEKIGKETTIWMGIYTAIFGTVIVTLMTIIILTEIITKRMILLEHRANEILAMIIVITGIMTIITRKHGVK